MNPYNVLGVEKTASPAEIKKRYRKKAKETHPDHGGNGAEFRDATRAYNVLMDKDHRARFDECGSMPDESRPVNPAISVLAEMFQSVLQTAMQGDDDRFIYGITAKVKKSLEAKLQEAEAVVPVAEKRIAKARLIISKSKFKGEGTNLMHTQIEQGIANLLQGIENSRRAAEVLREAIAMADDYEMEKDITPLDDWMEQIQRPGTIRWNG